MSNAGRIGERAEARFEGGLYCAEAVLTELAAAMGRDDPAIPRIATGMCAGVARCGATCGALSGAVMAIGLHRGRDDAAGSVEPAFAAASALVDRFTALHGEIGCGALTGCDLRTPEGQARFEDTGQHERCARYCRDAARIAAEILEL